MTTPEPAAGRRLKEGMKTRAGRRMLAGPEVVRMAEELTDVERRALRWPVTGFNSGL